MSRAGKTRKSKGRRKARREEYGCTRHLPLLHRIHTVWDPKRSFAVWWLCLGAPCQTGIWPPRLPHRCDGQAPLRRGPCNMRHRRLPCRWQSL